MTSKILVLFAAVILAWGSTGLAMAAPAEKEGPVIGQSFASKEMRPGDVWKVYLKASDPGEDEIYLRHRIPAWSGVLPSKHHQNPGRESERIIRVHRPEHCPGHVIPVIQPDHDPVGHHTR